MEVKQPEAVISQPKGAEHQPGTEQAPLIVKVAPTSDSDEERSEKAKERQQITDLERKKEKSDADLVTYTFELAL